MSTRPQQPATTRASRLRWSAVGSMFAVGIVLWVLGFSWGIALAGFAALGFIIAAWMDLKPQGGHVHDTGLSAYGVADTPRIAPDPPPGHGCN